jgi:hypothetical protein
MSVPLPAALVPVTLSRQTRLALWFQLLLFAALVAVSLGNELLDVPHLLLGSTPTSFDQRWGEVLIEVVAFAIVIGLEIGFIQKMGREIRVLQGLLPVCMHCKSIRHEGRWVPMEVYLTQHSMAHFSHGLCTDCLRKHHPEVAASWFPHPTDPTHAPSAGCAESPAPLSNRSS